MISSQGDHQGYQADNLRAHLKELLIAFEYFCSFSNFLFDSLGRLNTKAIKTHTFKEQPIKIGSNNHFAACAA